VIDVKARKGFVATTIAVVVALFLIMTSIYAISLGVGTLREERWMTEQAQRSLYPIAWSATNVVLQHLRNNIGIVNISGGSHSFDVKVGSENTSFDLVVSCDVSGSSSSVIRVTTGVSAGTLGEVIVRGFLSKDVPDWKIVWR